LARDITYPWGEARARHEWGLASLQNGEHEQARAQLAAAASLFTRLGAEPYRVQAEQTLAALDRPGAS
jgi:hypothetical protein